MVSCHPVRGGKLQPCHNPGLGKQKKWWMNEKNVNKIQLKLKVKSYILCVLMWRWAVQTRLMFWVWSKMTAAQTSMQSSRGARSDMNHTNGKEHACNERPLSAPKKQFCSFCCCKIFKLINKEVQYCLEAECLFSGHHVPCRTGSLWPSCPACRAEATSTRCPSRWAQPAGSLLILQTWQAGRPAAGKQSSYRKAGCVCRSSTTVTKYINTAMVNLTIHWIFSEIPKSYLDFLCQIQSNSAFVFLFSFRVQKSISHRLRMKVVVPRLLIISSEIL